MVGLFVGFAVGVLDCCLLVVDLVGCFLLEVFGLIAVWELGLRSFLLVLLGFGFWVVLFGYCRFLVVAIMFICVLVCGCWV